MRSISSVTAFVDPDGKVLTALPGILSPPNLLRDLDTENYVRYRGVAFTYTSPAVPRAPSNCTGMAGGYKIVVVDLQFAIDLPGFSLAEHSAVSDLVEKAYAEGFEAADVGAQMEYSEHYRSSDAALAVMTMEEFFRSAITQGVIPEPWEDQDPDDPQESMFLDCEGPDAFEDSDHPGPLDFDEDDVDAQG